MNGISLENVDHATAISVLKDSGSTVNLVCNFLDNLAKNHHSLKLPYNDLSIKRSGSVDECSGFAQTWKSNGK